jgi:AAA+ superfamily predicted ATPase
MERLLLRYGLRVIDVNFIPKNMCRGGSMLVSATPINGSRPQIKNFKSQVRTDLDELITFEVFSNKLSMAYRKLRNFIDNEKACGRKVAGYGGWGRGVTTLAIAKLTPRDLEFVIDQNINLHGKYTPVSSIQIISPNEAKNIPVDVIIVFNYAYMDEIKESLNWFTSSGGTLVSVLDLLN